MLRESVEVCGALTGLSSVNSMWDLTNEELQFIDRGERIIGASEIELVTG